MNPINIRIPFGNIFQRASTFYLYLPPIVKDIIKVAVGIFAVRAVVSFACRKILPHFVFPYKKRSRIYFSFDKNQSKTSQKPSSELDSLLHQIQRLKGKIKIDQVSDPHQQLQKIERQIGSLSDQIKDQPSKELQEKLEIELITYVNVLFSNGSWNLHYMSVLCDFMQKHSISKAFIYESLNRIDAFLSKRFFSSYSITTLERKQLTQFLKIANTHYDLLENLNPFLAQQLKLKFANLPLGDKVDRQKTYPKMYLSNRDQIDILIRRLENNENKCVNFLIEAINKGLLKKGEKTVIEKRLAKLIIDNSSLSLNNLLILRHATTALLKTTDNNLDGELKKIIRKSKDSVYYSKDPVDALEECAEKLSWNCKLKVFFANQKKLPDERIQIPMWYHCTNTQNVFRKIIFGDGPTPPCILVQKKVFKGAWVSREPEIDIYGQFGIALTSQITNEHDVDYHSYDWRGLQKAILLYSQTNQVNSATLFYVPRQPIGKKTKHICRSELKTQLGHDIPIWSTEVVDYMQKIISEELGLPNLPSAWFA